MTKCPYVPPHPWAVDFPHLMLRAKATHANDEGVSLRDRLLASTERVGRIAGIPVVAEVVNAVQSFQAGPRTAGKDPRGRPRCAVAAVSFPYRPHPAGGAERPAAAAVRAARTGLPARSCAARWPCSRPVTAIAMSRIWH